MRIFVDGAAGTVGMALKPHLDQMVAEGLVRVVQALGAEVRKDPEHRKAAAARADIVVLCLPDDLAPEAVALVRSVNSDAKILDASAAHRCAPDWIYGLSEVTAAPLIQQAKQIANPGCFATGCILLARPLARLLPPGPNGLPWVPFQGITGYSAGGNDCIPSGVMPWLTQMGVAHRHLPEIEHYAGVMPVLTTMVGDWYQGMLVQATLPLPAQDVADAYAQAYPDVDIVSISVAGEGNRRLSAKECNGTNRVKILIAAQPNGGVTVAAAYDNLGKGSAGAAADNLRLMLAGS